MIMKKSWFYLMCLCFTLSETFSVDTLEKCSIKDNECQKKLYQNLIKEAGKVGFPELNIPPLDPIDLKDLSVGVLDIVNLTLVEGVVKGIKNCILSDLHIDIEKGKVKQEILCDFTIKGHYLLNGEGEMLKQVLGDGGIHGDGNTVVKLEKLVITMKYHFYPVKKDDGEIYLKNSHEDLEYFYDVKGKATFAIDNIFLGKQNITDLAMRYLNDNWKYVLKTFGRDFVDKALEYYFNFSGMFFEKVPAKHFIIEDLTPYVRD